MATELARKLAQTGMDLFAKRRFNSVFQGEKIYLHIGMSKTGTTYIQQVFEKNRSLLKEQGLIFPPITMRSGGFSAGHTDLLSLKSQLGGKDLLNWVSDELEASQGAENVLFSSEYLVAKPEQLKRLRLLFEGHCVQVILYLRRQDEWLDSIYKEHTEGRHSFNTMKAEDFVEKQQILELNYEKLLEPIVQIFGETNILLRVYEKEQFQDGLLGDFAELVGIDHGLLSIEDVPSNPSAAIEDVELMRIINKIPYSGKANYDSFAMQVMQLLYESSNAKRKAMSPDLRCKVMERYQKNNQNVARKYLKRDKLFWSSLPSRNEKWEPVETISLKRLEQFIDVLIPFLEK
ncbi:MAG: hypothetical protein CMK59_10530 [Proteobacteria bacterium]|nr:hypothetical protein [Pseudomonadota bacterium]